MIYTVTLNPALDYVVQVEEFTLGAVNRTAGEQIYPGGKGINVSVVLNTLGYDSVALGFIAGFTGNQLIRELQKKGVRNDFISVERGMTRINVKVKGGKETEINGIGPEVPAIAAQVLQIQMERLKAGDVLVLSGSVPKTLPENIYEKLMARLEERNVLVIVDTSGEALTNTLRYKPFLIKPNHHELGQIFNVEISDKETAKVYAEKLQQMGARNVLVSMAEKGALLLDETGNIYSCDAPKGVVKNSVGAGDSMVAGFVAAFLETKDYERAFQMGVAAGSASAFSEYLPTKSDILEVYQENFC